MSIERVTLSGLRWSARKLHIRAVGSKTREELELLIEERLKMQPERVVLCDMSLRGLRDACRGYGFKIQSEVAHEMREHMIRLLLSKGYTRDYADVEMIREVQETVRGKQIKQTYGLSPE